MMYQEGFILPLRHDFNSFVVNDSCYEERRSLFPDHTLPPDIGDSGSRRRRRREYMQENHPILFSQMHCIMPKPSLCTSKTKPNNHNQPFDGWL